MKLIRLKIGTRFRSLPKDFEIIFSNPDPSSISNDPICFVGVNGSGKSNVLEALAEIFEYLDFYFLKYVNRIPNLSEVATIDKFIIEYLLPIEYETSGLFSNHIQVGNLEFAHIKIKKLSGGAPIFSEIVDDQSLPLKASLDLLPARVIGYSSGQNELISIPFKKLNFKYYHSIIEEQKNSTYVGYISPPRLVYMSYEDSSFVLLCNYIMQSEEEIEEIRSKTGVTNVDSFEIYISTHYRKENSFRITPDLQRFINFLKETASETLFSSSTNDRLRFVLTDEIRAKFRGQFPDASSLFNALSWLSLLNMNGIPLKRMSRLLSAPDIAYLGYRPFDYEPDYKLFSIDNILVRKIGVEVPVNYKTLSDGEHQFGFTMGLLSTFKRESTIFLLDEPETHFNPKWKYSYLEALKKVSGVLRNQVLLTTHDPVLISGLNKENILVFRKPETDLPRIYRPEKDLKGMGVDAILMSNIFEFDTAVDFKTKTELVEFRELSIKRSREELTIEENYRYKILYERLRSIDFAEPLNDPIYREYLSSFEDLDLYKKQFLTEDERTDRKRISEEIVAKMKTKLNQ